MQFRILMNALMAGSILFLPWWISVLLAVIILMLFVAYEILLWGLILDSLYAVPLSGFGEMEFLFTVLFALIFAAVLLIKKRLIFY